MGRKRDELAGQKFGRLTVIEFSHSDKTGKACWLCECECGNETTVRGNSLKYKTKSCGCLQKETQAKFVQQRTDLTGQKFGKLTVIRYSHLGNSRQVYWLCECECGNKTTVRSQSLTIGRTNSCGCLHRFPDGIAARNKVLAAHKYGAKIRGLDQALTDKQIFAFHKENCHYCDAVPSNVDIGYCNTGSYTYSGIDRMDNDKGYTLANSVSCCKFCNYAKTNLTYDEFLDQIKRIHSHLNL